MVIFIVINQNSQDCLHAFKEMYHMILVDYLSTFSAIPVVRLTREEVIAYVFESWFYFTYQIFSEPYTVWKKKLEFCWNNGKGNMFESDSRLQF